MTTVYTYARVLRHPLERKFLTGHAHKKPALLHGFARFAGGIQRRVGVVQVHEDDRQRARVDSGLEPMTRV